MCIRDRGSPDGQAVLTEGGLGAAVGQLLKDLPHCHIDGVADEVGVQGLQQGLAGQDLAGHGSGMGHAAAADGLYQRLLNDAILDIQGQLAGALLRRAPANAVGKAGDIADLV